MTKPIAYITGYHNGYPVVQPVDGAAVLPTGMALYAHPAPDVQPVALSEEALDKTTRRGAVVLDLFGGSGSTLIGCEKANRMARLMELDPKYCDVIVKRWQDFTGKKATHAETGKTFDEVHHGN